MPANAFNTSTLSEALTVSTNEFAVGSTTNISVGNLLIIGWEAVKVQEIPVSGRVRVMRGVAGTAARPHTSGDRFFIGAADAFKTSKESLTARFGDSGAYPDYLLPGQRATDGLGNEYVLVELAATTYTGTTVKISSDGLFTAVPLTSSLQGAVGVTVEQNSTAQYAWVQIYGFAPYVQLGGGSSAATSVSYPMAATSVNSPDVGLIGGATSIETIVIQGMYFTKAATTATTSATSSTGMSIAAWLNYPFVRVTVAS